MHPLIIRIQKNHDLGEAEAQALADGFLDGSLDDDEMKAALLAFNAKGIAVDELVGFAHSMRRHAVAIRPTVEVIDTCGTGGDGAGTFNISTASALLLAACGVAVAKHGNRSVSSRTGSADVLEVLGVPIGLPPEETRQRIESTGFGFLFAPHYHPAMKRVAPVRKALGVKTIFNMLGPLTNPARPESQVIGAYSLEAQSTMAQAAARLGIRRAFVVHGQGHDEAGLSSTRVLDVRASRIEEFTLQPEDFGIQSDPSVLRVENAQASAEKIRSALSDAASLESQVVCLNAALALVACGKTNDVQTGFSLAKNAVRNGHATAKLAQLTEASHA